MPSIARAMDFTQTLSDAMAHHHAGRLPQAEAGYRRILALDPNHPEALHLLGVLAHQVQNHQAAIDLIRAALRFSPHNAGFYNNLGNACQAMGRSADAIACYRRAIVLDPRLVAAHHNLGCTLQAAGLFEQAVDTYRTTIALKPDHAHACANLSGALLALGEITESIRAARRACALDADLPAAHANLAAGLLRIGELDEALSACQIAIKLSPEGPGAGENFNTLGNILRQQNDFTGAVAAYRSAISLSPALVEIRNNYAVALRDAGELPLALRLCREAIAMNPGFAVAHDTLGNLLKDDGQIEQAVGAYQTAIRLNPTFTAAHSNFCLAIHHHPGYDAAEILRQQQRFSEVHAAPLRAHHRPHYNDRHPDRRLRIGYVSPDYREHPVGHMLLEVLANHDRERFEVFCYSNGLQFDPLTREMRRHADHWRNLHQTSDDRAEAIIRADKIDILIDLAGHTSDHRLLLFARKPAPVQINHMAYPATTGLDTIDYRITDSHLDPPELGDVHSAEKLLRLPHSYWFYTHDGTEPPVAALPALSRGHITFGSLNNPCKYSPLAIDLWSKVLHEVPNSRLMLLTYDRGGRSDAVTAQFHERGIHSDRLIFQARLPRRGYLDLYNQIDIGLDPLPYGSHSTGLDALFMGVPLVSLAGSTSVGRAGASLLRTVGLDSLVAQTPQAYIATAAALSCDLPYLAHLRSGLRDQMRACPLSTAPAYTKALENLYRLAWRNYCSSK